MHRTAIIGISGLFPGSSTKEAFWDNLMQGRDLTGHATDVDFGADTACVFDPVKGMVDKCYSLRGGYIRDFNFNPSGYYLPEELLARQDKLYQWTLHVAREALRDAGIDIGNNEQNNPPAILQRCGLVLGNLSFPTATSHRMLSPLYTGTLENGLQRLLHDAHFQLGTHQNLQERDLPDWTLTGMTQAALGLGGAHYALDAACASSLYAIKLACDTLRTGKTDIMLAGAVCASDQLFIHMGFSIFQAYAGMDEKFSPLDKDSAGLVSSEGAGMVVLKRLEDAERDGDTILGVIGGIGLSNDGRGKFLLSPHPKGQRLAFERAYLNNNSAPRDTHYIECHATGTPLGDLTEINSVADFFSPHGVTPLLGSIKSNMGHLLTAAGMSGLMKVLLSMQKEVIPPNIHIEHPIHSKDHSLGSEQMIMQPALWKTPTKQAGINAFGFGGTNAHMVIQQHVHTQASQRQEASTPLLPMAITGMDVHFGACDGLDAFYSTIFHGTQHFRDLPENRWKGFDEDTALLNAYGFADGKAPRGAYIEDFEIDLLRYKIQPREAATLEPQQALLLKVADRAIRDAGLEECRNVAVLIAMESELAIHHYLARWNIPWQLNAALERSGIQLDEDQQLQLEELCKNSVYAREGQQTPSQHTSFVGNIMASRVSALWDFTGPAFTISCGENSVFMALETAQHLLSFGEVEAVVVGGVDFSGGLEHVLLRNRKERVNAAAKPGISLDHDSEGWLIGEGAGALVLQRPSDIKDGKVYATIDSMDIAGPLAEAGYLELHGSGMRDDNAGELSWLKAQSPEMSVAIGCVKANIGHTFAASGIAGVIKTALCLHHRFIPAISNWKEPRDREDFENSKYYFPSQSRPWIPEGNMRRHAVVIGADQRHIRMSESPVHAQAISTPGQFTVHFFTIKGNSEQDLQQQLAALEIANENTALCSDVARLFYERHFAKESQYCIVLIAGQSSGLAQEIAYFKTHLADALHTGRVLKTPRGSYFTPRPLGKRGKIAFVYPGSSTAYPYLGTELFQLFPQLHAYFDHILPGSREEYFWPQYLYPKTLCSDSPIPDIYDNAIAMMSVGVLFSTAYTYVLREFFRIEPAVAFGYSMGECSSMWYALGIWGAEETHAFRSSPIFKNRFTGALELLAEHWKVSPGEAKARWTSLVLLAPRQEVEVRIQRYENIFLTFVNTENEIVISGDKTACHALAAELQCPVVKLPFQNIIHHPFCAKERTGLLNMHNFPLRAKPNIEFYSSITQSPMPLHSEHIADNSTTVCCQQVDFPNTVNTIYDDGARIFIEVGAQATCTGWIRQILVGKEHLATSVNQKGKSEGQALLECLAQLVSHGVPADLSMLYPTHNTTTDAKRVLKHIVPGGKRIFDVLLNAEVRDRFATKDTQKIIHKKHSMVMADSDLGFPDQIHNTPMMTSPQIPRTTNGNVSTPGKNGKPRLGENGLPLQDYASGEHLAGKTIIFSQQDLEEFATGSIAKVFGPEYAVIDSFHRRVMLPMHPYLLVSRVTGLQATRGEFKPSTMQTEYDIPYDAWFTTDRQIPWAVSVESGQCDLLLISYLGIDFQNKGNLVYRLLDCTLTFVDDLPFEGQTLRYDISINSFVRNGDNLLFFFSYRCYIGARLVLKMDGGCAGFFTDAQLEEGNGVVYTDKELQARRMVKKKQFIPLLTTHKRAFSKDDLWHLIRGEMEKCFDDISYFANGRNPSLCLPPEEILMLDRITSVELTGGVYGLGYLVAEKDLHPDDWYFPCHFRDDEVLAGSLQAEGGGNLLRFFMLMLGLQRSMKDARYQPVFDVPQKVRCRKQVTPQDTLLVYKLEIKEIGLVPNPYVIGDLEILSDGIVTVHFENLGLQLREKSQPRYLETHAGVNISSRSKGALLNEHDITMFALDDLSKCFGPEFAVYDGRSVSRQPNTDLQLISRVLSIDGARHDFSRPATIIAEYDVPQDAWYYRENSAMVMPYSILMEIALQPCGLLGAFLGSTLQFPEKNLFFRNLDGEGTLTSSAGDTDFRNKTVTNTATLVSSVALGGTILQNYTFELSIDGEVFYYGKSSFGFFPGEALATQAGLDNGKEVAPWYQATQLLPKDYMQINLDSLYGAMKLFTAPAGKPHYRLAQGQLKLLDRLLIAKQQGQNGKGYLHATRYMQPYDWFFTCHFYQDPVMPGSLGVEAILQAMQVFALQQDLGKSFLSPGFTQLLEHRTQWKYRGQILRDVKEMHVEVHIKALEMRGRQYALIADASVWNGRMRIYHITDIALGIEEMG